MRKTKLFVLIAILALAFCLVSTGCGPKTLELVGDADVVINIGEEFIDEGTNLEVDVEGSVDTNTVGDYTLTYTYEDQQLTRTVHVVDPDMLVVGLYGHENTVVREGDPYVESGAFGTDVTSGPVADYEVAGEVDTAVPGTYEVRYTFKVGYLEKQITRNVEVIAKDKFVANTDGVPVLMYHYVYTDTNRPDTLNANYISDVKLREQLTYLTENDCYFPSFDELRAYVDGKIALPAKSVILTFDDGKSYFLENGIPILNEFKVPATSFVIGTKKGPEIIKEYATEYVAFESHSFDMHKAGGNIGHGGVISAMTKDQIVNDLKMAIDMTGSSNAFAFPYGDITDDGKAAVAEAGIDVAFSTVNDKAYVGDDFRALCRVRINGDISLDSYIASL